MGRSVGKTVVGLDIEPGYVAAVETRAGHVAVERAATAPLAPGVVRDGEVVDVETLAEVLRTMFAEHKLSQAGPARRRQPADRHAHARPSAAHATPRRSPRPSASRPRTTSRCRSSRRCSSTSRSASSRPPTGPRTRVVLVAARRDMIERLLEATPQGGPAPARDRPLGVRDDPRAAPRRRQRRRRSTSASAGMTNLAVAAGTDCVFTRVVAHGTESIAGELAERRGLTLEHAHGWLKHVGLLTAVERRRRRAPRSWSRRATCSPRACAGSPTRSATRSTSTACRRAPPGRARGAHRAGRRDPRVRRPARRGARDAARARRRHRGRAGGLGGRRRRPARRRRRPGQSSEVAA